MTLETVETVESVMTVKTVVTVETFQMCVDLSLCQLIFNNYSIDEAVWKSTSRQSKYLEHLTIHDGSCQATDHIN